MPVGVFPPGVRTELTEEAGGLGGLSSGPRGGQRQVWVLASLVDWVFHGPEGL